MPETVGPSQIYINVEQAHDNRGHSQKLTQNDHIMQSLVMVNIGRYHQHHCGSGKSDDESEVSDVKAP